jgi:hypothetical protein
VGVVVGGGMGDVGVVVGGGVGVGVVGVVFVDGALSFLAFVFLTTVGGVAVGSGVVVGVVVVVGFGFGSGADGFGFRTVVTTGV